jgi:amiloride-sensitive sodium channel
LLVSGAILGVFSISLQLSEKFSSSPLSTVVESTIFPVAEIAYPSITICPHNRLHVNRCKEAEAKFLPNATEDTLKMFRLVLASLNNIEFAAFDEFSEEIFEHSSPDLRNLSLPEVYHFAMLECEEIFLGKCWWRSKFYNCCEDFFVLQTTEYGLCYSFNSAVNEIGFAKEVVRD